MKAKFDESMDIGSGTRQNRELDERLAAVVAKEFNHDCWPLFASPPREDAELIQMTHRAVELWRTTYNVAGTRSRDLQEAPHPLDTAVFIVNEIAAGYALISKRWSEADRERLPMPVRSDLERAILVGSVNQWTSSFGFPLAIADQSMDFLEPYLDPHKARPIPTEGEVSSAAESFAEVGRTYRTVADLYQRRDPAIKGDQIRVMVIQLVVQSRQWARWMVHYLDPRLAVAGTAMTYMGAGCFVACWSNEFDEPMIPSTVFLARLLRGANVGEWLDAHEVDVPEWLTATPVE